MGRRSTKRIVLDEVAKRSSEVKRLFREYETSPIWYKKAMVKLQEAKYIALLLGATTDEVYQAECDGETMANATE